MEVICPECAHRFEPVEFKEAGARRWAGKTKEEFEEMKVLILRGLPKEEREAIRSFAILHCNVMQAAQYAVRTRQLVSALTDCATARPATDDSPLC
jgi:hypothetical protein